MRCALQVHQHHPPLVYGRSMQGDPETSTGAAVCQGLLTGAPVFVAITFECAICMAQNSVRLGKA